MNPKIIGKAERFLVYGFFGTVDFVQLILSIFVVTEVANHIIDIVVGIILLAYGGIRKLWTPQKLLVLAAVFVGEQIPFVNALPFWVLDIKNLYSGTITAEEAEQSKEQDNLSQSATTPLNNDGVRSPQNQIDAKEAQQRPVNIAGVRPPSK